MLCSNTSLLNKKEVEDLLNDPAVQKQVRHFHGANKLEVALQRIGPMLLPIFQLVLIDQLEQVPPQKNEGLQLLLKALCTSFEKSEIDEEFEFYGLLTSSREQLCNDIHQKIESLVKP